jgi:hypothetical protein
MNSLTTPLH